MNSRRLSKTIELAAALFDPQMHGPRCFVACFVYHKGTLMSVGVNSEKTNPTNLKNPLSCRRSGKFIDKRGTCAELHALIQLKNKTNLDFESVELVNVRIDRQGNIGMAKPCISCESLLEWAKPKRVYYTKQICLPVNVAKDMTDLVFDIYE